MTMEYIRTYYQVPACVGGRVEYTGGKTPRMGTITGSRGPHLLVKLDGEEIATPFHPTWELRILSAIEEVLGETSCMIFQHPPCQHFTNTEGVAK